MNKHKRLCVLAWITMMNTGFPVLLLQQNPFRRQRLKTRLREDMLLGVSRKADQQKGRSKFSLKVCGIVCAQHCGRTRKERWPLSHPLRKEKRSLGKEEARGGSLPAGRVDRAECWIPG